MKTVLVTSGAKGIGAAIVRRFASSNYQVAFTYLTGKTEADALMDELSNQRVKTVGIPTDLTNESQVAELGQQVKAQFGHLDVLVNNFGLAEEPDFEQMDKTDIVTAISNSLVSTMLVTKAFVPKQMPSGSVINLTTIYAQDQGGSIGLPVYSAAKAGVLNFTQTMAKRYAPHVRFNSVAPGFTVTPHWDPISEERKKACIDMTLLKQWIQPEDIADAVYFLSNAKHITAQSIVVDAGWSKK